MQDLRIFHNRTTLQTTRERQHPFLIIVEQTLLPFVSSP